MGQLTIGNIAALFGIGAVVVSYFVFRWKLSQMEGKLSDGMGDPSPWCGLNLLEIAILLRASAVDIDRAPKALAFPVPMTSIRFFREIQLWKSDEKIKQSGVDSFEARAFEIYLRLFKPMSVPNWLSKMLATFKLRGLSNLLLHRCANSGKRHGSHVIDAVRDYVQLDPTPDAAGLLWSAFLELRNPSGENADTSLWDAATSWSRVDLGTVERSLQSRIESIEPHVANAKLGTRGQISKGRVSFAGALGGAWLEYYSRNILLEHGTYDHWRGPHYQDALERQYESQREEDRDNTPSPDEFWAGVEKATNEYGGFYLFLEHPFHDRVLWEVLTGDNRKYPGEMLSVRRAFETFFREKDLCARVVWYREQLPFVGNGELSLDPKKWEVSSEDVEDTPVLYVSQFGAIGRSPGSSWFVAYRYRQRTLDVRIDLDYSQDLLPE